MTSHNTPIDSDTLDAAMEYTKLWEGVHSTVGPDSKGVPTLGHGFALIIDIGNEWVIRSDLIDKLATASITLEPEDLTKLIEIQDALAAGDIAEAKRLTVAHDFPSITGAQAETLFRETITEKAEMARDKMGAAAFDRLSPERQAVVIDTAYQRPREFRKIAARLAAAVTAGDHERGAEVLESVGGGGRLRATDNARYYRDPYDGTVVRVYDIAGVIALDNNMSEKEFRDLNQGLGPKLRVTMGQLVRIAPAIPAAPYADLAGKIEEQNENSTEAAPLGPGQWRVEKGQSLWIIAQKLDEKLGRNVEVEELMELNGITEDELTRVPIGRVLVVPTDGAAPAGTEATPPAQPAPADPGPRGGLLGEMGVDLAELSYEARRILGNRLGFDPLDETRVAANRERVEATAEEAFFRDPGFDGLPPALGRQLFAAGLQSSPGRAADLLTGALAEAGAPPRKRRKGPGRPSVRRTVTPEIAQAVRRAEGAGQLGRVRETLALDAFGDFATRAAADRNLTRGLDGALRRSLGLAFRGRGRPEVRALQAIHNELPYVTHGRHAPIAVDGVAGPKTRTGFMRTLESMGPERMARGMAERLRRA